MPRNPRALFQSISDPPLPAGNSASTLQRHWRILLGFSMLIRSLAKVAQTSSLCIADFQSAGAADWKSAIQQVGNLRYDGIGMRFWSDQGLCLYRGSSTCHVWG